VILELIDQTETLLTRHAALGRPGRVMGTRELVIGNLPYIIPYRVRDGEIEILRVLHTARRWPGDV
jgi:toxin ParE1/3/4